MTGDADTSKLSIPPRKDDGQETASTDDDYLRGRQVLAVEQNVERGLISS